MPTLWYQPQTRRDAIESIESTIAVISFINESIAFTTTKEYSLSDIAAAGLCNVLTLVEGVLKDCNKKLLMKEVA